MLFDRGGRVLNGGIYHTLSHVLHVMYDLKYVQERKDIM